MKAVYSGLKNVVEACQTHADLNTASKLGYFSALSDPEVSMLGC